MRTTKRCAIAVAAAAVVLFPTLAQSAQNAYIRVCKHSAKVGPVSGTFTFTYTDAAGTPKTVTVAVGHCSGALGVKSGKVKIVEQPKAGTKVTAITGPNPDLANRSTVVDAKPGITVVHFTNQSTIRRLVKVCKVAGPGVAVGKVFSFTANGGASVNVPAGPEPYGYCRPLGFFLVQTIVNVKEAAISGVQVSGITATPAAALVGAPNIAGRSVNVRTVAGTTMAIFTNRVPKNPWSYIEGCFPTTGGKSDFGDSVSINVKSKFGDHGTYSVPIGACTPPIGVAAGNVTITLKGAGLNLASCRAFPKRMQRRCDRKTGASTVRAVEGGKSGETVAFLTVRR